MKSRKAGNANSTGAANSVVDPEASTGKPALGVSRPILPPEIEEYFEPVKKAGNISYQPALLGEAKVHFTNTAAGIDVWEKLSLVSLLNESLPDEPWTESELSVEDPPEREKTPDSDARFAPLPPELARPKSFSALTAALKDHLYRNHVLKLFKYTPLKITSQPGEEEGDFRVRVAAKVSEQRDEQIQSLRAKYATRRKTLEDKIMRAQQKLEREKSQAQSKMMDAAISIGSTIFGSLMGRKTISATTLGKAATAAKTATKVAGQKQDVAHAEESLEVLNTQLADLDAQIDAEVEALKSSANPQNLELEVVELSPKKTEIQIDRVALYWRC